MKAKTYQIAEMSYDRAAANQLRNDMIQIRDEALKCGAMEWSVVLSHVVAFMAAAIPIMYAEEKIEEKTGA